ncbi:MAG: TraR/DksA family transcriptional regulator [Betaproteobacteria bacterium]|nr:TraR/DksA family transcriptional regulator [Betaproteobacteria bacterium]
MRYLTIEQREALGAHIDGRAGALRDQIATALKQPGNSETMHLANHLAEIDDDAVADLETSLDIAAIERGLAELRALEGARERLHGPEFGVCVDCENEIPYRRLMANLGAIRCVACQEHFERTHANRRAGSI